MAKKLKGEEARAAQGNAASAALNAIAAAKRVADAEAARVDQEIAADHLMTPAHLTGPTTQSSKWRSESNARQLADRHGHARSLTISRRPPLDVMEFA